MQSFKIEIELTVECRGVGLLGVLCHVVRGTEEWPRDMYP